MNPRRVSPLAVLLLLGGSVAMAAPDESAGIDRFLRAWVDGRAEFEVQAEFHRLFPRSPHKLDSERFEVAWTCLRSRESLTTKARASLIRDLLARLAGKETASEVRGRVVFVLGRLQAPEAVPRLVGATLEGDPESREEAIRALGPFGNRACLEGFSVFGGRFRWVVFPASHDPRATRALLAVLDEPRPSRPRFPKGFSDLPREERSRIFEERMSISRLWRNRRSSAMRALESHVTPEVEKVALALGRPPTPNLDLLAALDLPATVDRLIEITRDGSWDRRIQAIQALGSTSRRASVERLIELVGDDSPVLRREAEASLAQIVDGTNPYDCEAKGGMARQEYWRARLGPNLERFDEEAARRRMERKPGVYVPR
jgi:hypothetical protein